MKTFHAVLRGIRPCLFDRYPGDNNTKLAAHEKLYLDEQSRLILPTLNLYSLLAAKNTPSVARRFCGKKWKDAADGIMGFCGIWGDTENREACFFRDENGEPIVYDKMGGKIQIVHHVARVKDGIPNPKERPRLNLPWSMNVQIDWVDNQYVKERDLKQMVENGGFLGLGTFRPMFGQYVVDSWSEEKKE